jgi:flagellar biosynthesis protein FlhG
MIANEKEAKNVFGLLSSVADRHLSVSLSFMGFVPQDQAVAAAVRTQTPFFLSAPEAEASRQMLEVAKRILANPPDLMAGGGLAFFLNRLADLGVKVE